LNQSQKIGGYDLSVDSPPVFLAEVGGFFSKDLVLAKDLLQKIVESSNQIYWQPTLFKTEILHDAEICLPGNYMETYASKDGRVRKENYRELVERKIFPLKKYANLFKLCRDENINFVTSIYDFKGIDFAVDNGVAALKIASGNIVHIPLIRHAAKSGLPIIIDSGRSSLAEVDTAYNTALEAGANTIIIEHSPDGHPARPEAHNLQILDTYSTVFKCPVGLSDHHVGVEMLYMSVALGASLIEKGVHSKPDDLDIDISHTMDLKELPHVLKNIYNCWMALGANRRNKKTNIDGIIGSSQRPCVVAKTSIEPGEKIDLDLVYFAWPCVGISAEFWDLVEGARVVSQVKAGTPIKWSDLCLN
jgi:sialic acid synthase SpsE